MQRAATRAAYLAVCLNPVIQKTLVYERLAKGEVNRTSVHRVDAAGKGVCAARVLGQLGREAIHLTHLGGPTRDWFLSLCQADGLRVAWAESGSEIRFCTTLVDRAEGSATELVEEAQPVGAGTEERIVAEFDRILPEVGTVLLSGTKAAGYSPAVMAELARRASGAGKRLFLDLKGADLVACLPFRPVAAKPNLEELLQTYAPAEAEAARSGELTGALRELVARIAREWFEAYGTCLVATRGSRPTLFWDGETLRERAVRRVEAINPIGSGDSFGVGLATALEEGASVAEAVDEGARLGALNAERLKPGSIA